MRSNKGVTLTSLILYIMIATIVIGTMAVISSNFFFNVGKTRDQNEYAEEFNKFNMFFIQDVKNHNTAEVTDTTITFENGSIYIYNPTKKNITRNGIVIAKNIENLQFSTDTYTVKDTIKNLINVNMSIGKNNVFQKEIEYVLKYW
ncbi:MAG: hypothetical protein ACI4UU_01010 [Clostridia bacterium]